MTLFLLTDEERGAGQAWSGGFEVLWSEVCLWPGKKKWKPHFVGISTNKSREEPMNTMIDGDGVEKKMMMMMGAGTHRRDSSSCSLSPAFAIVVALTIILSCCGIRGVSANMWAPSSVSPPCGVGVGLPHHIIQRRQSSSTSRASDAEVTMYTIVTIRGGNNI